MITVLYFASLREDLGIDREQVDAVPPTVAALRQVLEARHQARWQQAAGGVKLLVAVNQEMAADSTVLEDGDEVAFFPPVTGG